MTDEPGTIGPKRHRGPVFCPLLRSLRRCVLCVAFFLILVPTDTRAADVDLPTYAQRLTVARDALTQAQTQTGAMRDASVRRATDALAGVDGVTVDGTRYPAQHGDALDALRRAPPELDRALAVVTTLQSAVAETQAAKPDAQARQKLDDILRDRAYHAAEPNAAQKQFLRFRAWLGEQWRKLTEPLRRADPPAPNTPDTVPGAGGFASLLAFLVSPPVLIALALVIAGIVIILLLRRRKKRDGPKDHAEPQRTAGGWRVYAAELAARGDHRGAVRALFLGTLTEFDERGLVSFDATRTDREYLREAQRQQGWLAEPFRPFVRLVEAVFYADAPCGDAEYERARAYADDVSRTIAAPQGVAA